MTSRNKLPVVIAALLLGGLLLVGLYVLLSARFSSGDIFPDYSSYRVGPKGTKMLYKALSALPEKQIERQIERWKEEQSGQGTSMLLLGMNRSGFLAELEQNWADYIQSGGRCIVALNANAPENIIDEFSLMDFGFPFSETLGVSLQSATNSINDVAKTAISETTGEEVPWHGALHFSELDDAWTVRYRSAEEPVMIERTWGEGSIVLMTDSYLFSNEAMVNDRHTELISELLGPAHRILFDETHLGVVSQESIMMMANRHRFHGVLIAFLVLVGLFIWQRMSSLLPRRIPAQRADNPRNAWSGTHQGFTNLLRRHVPKKQLIHTAIEEWAATFENDPAMRTKRKKIQSALETYKLMGEVKDPAECYNNLTRMINERK